MDYDKWKAGNRLSVNGNITSWIKTHAVSNSYKDFRKYLEIVFTYAGTLSLNKSLKSKKLKDLEPGDVFIIGGSPGHAVTVMDVVENNKGEKLLMLAQSYMPAQETHILKNFNNPELSPWYKADFEGSLYTPQWKFEKENLKSW